MSEDATTDNERYRDNPFLRLVDCYVLDAIGALPPEQLEALERLEPRLQETFGSRGDWREIVQEQVGFLPSIPLEIQAAWVAYQQQGADAGQQVTPTGFVLDFVAQNLAGLDGDAGPAA